MTKKKKLKSRNSKKYKSKSRKNKKPNKDSSELIYKVKKEWIKKATINKSAYEEKYTTSLKDNDTFWKKEGKRINWIKPYTKIKDIKYSKSEVKIKWFYDGTLNASANCIDRHLKKK